MCSSHVKWCNHKMKSDKPLICWCSVQIEEDESGDTFDMHISVSDPEKVGECSLNYSNYVSHEPLCSPSLCCE